MKFLVDAEKAEYLQRFQLEESRYRITIDLIEERSKIVLNWLQPKLENLSFTPETNLNINDLESKLGIDLTNKLKSLTNAIIQFADENLISMRELDADFSKILEALFKEEKILKVVYERKI